jgi:nicotinate-nucleotide pyrophosphorylase (carboxylating)
MSKQEQIKKYFNQKEKLTLKNKNYLEQIKKFTLDLLESDITSNQLIKKNKIVKAIIFTKEEGIVAGLEEAAWFLDLNKIKSKKLRKDGDKIKNNEVLLELRGKIKDILKTERIVLNLLQRMSGIATDTHNLIIKTKNNVLICPTRKTLWGLLDKKAVSVGGGGTHRLSLNDFILIKDNHIKFLGNRGIDKKAISLNKNKKFWEIEVKDKQEAIWAACLKPRAIMFDNFKARKIKRLIPKITAHFPDIIFEASGQINEENIRKYSKTGVDIISCGQLTHSSRALDISLDIL